MRPNPPLPLPRTQHLSETGGKCGSRSNNAVHPGACGGFSVAQLTFMPVLRAWNTIEAVKVDGTSYGSVRGISVSSSGKHFRFWLTDVHREGKYLHLLRSEPRRPDWLNKPQGRSFLNHLILAKESGSDIFGIINSQGKPDSAGNSTAPSAAPILTKSGKPARGKVLIADSTTGEMHVKFSLDDA